MPQPCSQHVSPTWSAKERVLMLYFNTNVGATLKGRREYRQLGDLEARAGVVEILGI